MRGLLITVALLAALLVPSRALAQTSTPTPTPTHTPAPTQAATAVPASVATFSAGSATVIVRYETSLGELALFGMLFLGLILWGISFVYQLAERWVM